LSKPDDWQCRTSDIEREGNIGITARRSMMLEAEKAGYLTYHRARDGKGRFADFYMVHEEPVTASERTQSWTLGVPNSDEPGTDEPGTGFPGADKPGAENPGGTKYRYTNTDIQNTERQKKNLVEAEPPPHISLRGSPSHKEQAKEVFEYWLLVMKKTGAKFTPEREGRITSRLKQGYSVEEIKQAIDGCKASPFHMGENAGNKKYNEIELICRNGTYVEKFKELAPKKIIRQQNNPVQVKKEYGFPNGIKAWNPSRLNVS
jgi:hypothetical protein